MTTTVAGWPSIALVTGSTRGIGFGIAARLASDGVSVIVNGRDPRETEEAAERLRGNARGRVLAIAADVSDATAVDRLVDQAIKHVGLPNVLVNNAALSGASVEAHFLESYPVHWDQIIRGNLTSLYLCSFRLANEWVDAGAAGSIINISSIGAQRAHRMAAAYDATKGGVDALTRAMAVDLAPFQIRVNAVAPGAIHVGDQASQSHLALDARGAEVPLGRVGTPADIAAAVAFFASTDAAYITGIVLPVDGGVLAQLRGPSGDVTMPDSVIRRWGEPRNVKGDGGRV